MSLGVAILCGIIYWLAEANLPFVGLWTLQRPLVCGFLTGCLLGQPVTGAVVGATINLVYLGFISAGGLIVNYVKVKCGITISTSGSDFSLQESLFDAVLPNILPLAATMGIYGLMQKKWTSIKIILLIVVVGVVCGFFNILVA